MSTHSPDTYLEVADAAWRWVSAQVRWHDGPWIPAAVPAGDTDGDLKEVAEYRDGTHSGIGGLAMTLAELRAARPWRAEEAALARAVVDRVRNRIPAETDCTYFDGLVSTIGVLRALNATGVEQAVRRILALATPDGWPQTAVGPPDYPADTRVNDLVLGTAGVLLGAVWAREVPVARELGDRAAAVLLAEMETVPTGVNWPFVPRRFRADAPEMPNFSHGLAGIATALALAGAAFGRPDLIRVAALGAAHLVTLGDTSDGGLVVPRTIPHSNPDHDEFTHNWCHGGAGTSLLFLALEHAGVAEVAGESPRAWHRRCLRGVRASGLPARRHPGFWDNDGRCCGTAGVGDVFLDSWQRYGEPEDLEFARLLADTLVDHAVVEGRHAYWRFTEHRDPEPLLPPGVSWGQGAVGIAAFLFRVSRVVRVGRHAPAVSRMDNWWAHA